MIGNIHALLEVATFDADGLITVIAQDRATGVVRMQAWANREALAATASTGRATFWSRRRKSLREKGATSGNSMRVTDIRIDCDGDSVLYVAEADGPSCHTGATSCYFRALAEGDALRKDDGPPELPAGILSRVSQVIAQRRREKSSGSYVASLLEEGWPRILEKITEEAREVVEALPAGDKAHATREAADVIFHLLVGLEAAGVPVDSVFSELRGRFGTSGLTEKANRAPKTQKP